MVNVNDDQAAGNNSTTTNNNNNIIDNSSASNLNNNNNNNNNDHAEHDHHENDGGKKAAIIINEWPYGEQDLYRIALHFYRDNEGKAFHPSYDQRNLLVAYTFQEKHGKFTEDKAIPLGALDFVGSDRRNAWISLGDMSKSDARKNFVQSLNQLCPFFHSYLIAVKCDLEEKEKKRLELEQMKKQETELMEKMKAEEMQRNLQEEKRKQYEKQKLIIQETLNRQTFNQFSNYAKQQYPDSPESQQRLIKQLQEQHFEQYIQQMTQQSQEEFLQKFTTDDNVNAGQQRDLTENIHQLSLNSGNHLNHYGNHHHDNIDGDHHNHVDPQSSPTTNNMFAEGEEAEEDDDDDDDEEEESEESNYSKQMNNASMWTRKDIVAFKESVQSEGGHGIIKVGHGEIATIRVPTHDDGSCIFWEFATDYYDIGFGLFFEWNSSPDSQVSICFSESEEDEEEEQEQQQQQQAYISTTGHDIEKGNNRVLLNAANKNNGGSHETHASVSAIIPIYRRDSHEEVFAGSHVYPGKGVYLLKFDNSYSLWRSKTLYYRVYYTKEP